MYITKNEDILNSLFKVVKILCGHMNDYILILVKCMKKILGATYYW